MTHFWVRSEYRDDEFRTPLTPLGARKLLDKGLKVTVEESHNRAFSIDEYQSVGCRIVGEGSWVNSDPETIILGLKELSNEVVLSHRHIMFAHAYKDQKDSKKILTCFKKGGGVLYDLEFLTDIKGNRVAAFGHYAGFAGAAVGLKIWIEHKRGRTSNQKKIPVNTDKITILGLLKKMLSEYIGKTIIRPRIIIIGAHGRVGMGAREFFNSLDLGTTNWDLKETACGGPFQEILDYDIFVNCVLASEKSKPFINKKLLELPRKLFVISDVSCDPGSKYNTIPLYDQPTSFENPYHCLMFGDSPLYITAIDNLPTMLPRESSLDFEKQILSHLIDFKNDNLGVWKRAKEVFDENTRAILI